MILLLLACVAGATETWTHYGAPFAVAQPLAANTVLADPAAHAQGPVRFKAEATEVCQKMGCWLVVRDDAGRAMRVTMKDHAFGVDKAAAGHTCDLEGTLVKHAVDPKQVEHYVSEGSNSVVPGSQPGTSPPEAGKTEVWELVATSVAVSKG